MSVSPPVSGKECRVCGEFKMGCEFNRRKSAKDGLKNECKECERAYQKAYREKNAETISANQGKYRSENRKQLAAQSSEYYYANIEECKATRRRNGAEYRKNHPDKAKSSKLKSVYGIDLDEYNAMAEAQGHVCQICQRKRKLCVDHCHKTGKVRGLLCRNCNSGIGALGDNLEGLRKALQYLEGVKK